jgi:hypothetical protein
VSSHAREAAIGREAIPELSFAVTGVSSPAYVAAPTMTFELEVAAEGAQSIRAVLLDVQIQIAARLRPYGEPEQERLAELFGAANRWATTLRTLPWSRTTVVVPPFSGTTTFEVPVACTYDLEVTSARYLASLEDGEVPLEFLFSGTIFYSASGGRLQTARIDWNREAQFRLPVSVWRQTMDRHFPGCAWVRMGQPSFDRLCAYKARNAHTSFDAAIESLLSTSQGLA